MWTFSLTPGSYRGEPRVRIRRPYWLAQCIVGLILLGSVLAGPGRAAKFLQCELVVDGSAKPPGDQLNLSLFLAPAEQAVSLEIRGSESWANIIRAESPCEREVAETVASREHFSPSRNLPVPPRRRSSNANS